MAGLGFSVSELISAGRTCKDIVNSFTDTHGNSSARVELLASQFETLFEGLETHKSALEKVGSKYKGYESFKRTLDECNAFIEKYQVLRDNRRTHPATWWRTALFTFEKENVAQLQNQIGLQMNVMQMWTNVWFINKQM
jgi:hypothetical protein